MRMTAATPGATRTVSDADRVAFGCPSWCDRPHPREGAIWGPGTAEWVQEQHAPIHAVDISAGVTLVEEDGTAWINSGAGRLSPQEALALGAALLQAVERSGYALRRGSRDYGDGLDAGDALLRMAHRAHTASSARAAANR